MERPALIVRAAWREGALLARLAFVDRASGAFAAFSAHGAVTASAGRFVRWAPEIARGFARRFLEAGFVPRGGDGFALHDEVPSQPPDDFIGGRECRFGGFSIWLPKEVHK